uniref:TSA: Wollemia nobilis Ref_Wollemi_Transcript_14262_2005 transcribed RNA sequence n=1 Tax=Wollemia nobilis TaxID=56998 RepID=A0A0C9S450_9CONI
MGMSFGEQQVIETLQGWKERPPWMGRVMGFLFTIGFAGFCLCYFALLHSFQGGYYAVPHGTVAPESTGYKINNSSFSQAKSNSTTLKSSERVLEATAENDHDASDADSPFASLIPDTHVVTSRRMNSGSQLQHRTDLQHIVFGIGASADLWHKRKEYVKLWWQPGNMRGYVWFDKQIPAMRLDGGWERDGDLPPWRISSDTSQFKYSHRNGWRSAIRISRIVSETFRQGLPDVHWFVMGDDDTVFVAENLVSVLSKYDHTEFYYVGGNSESHIQNQYLSFNMAFGGGGFAISYPLAKALEQMQDKCLTRYHHLFGSDDRVQACVAELGVGLTREAGFHQMDINGNPFGLLAAHPIAPLVSVHHLDVLEPFFSNLSRVESVKHLLQAARFDPAALLQQSICYDRRRKWSVSVSWGYAVQIFRGMVSPRELEKPMRTFSNWQQRDDFIGYPFNTRPIPPHPCQRPFVFGLNKISYAYASPSTVISEYTQPRISNFPTCSGKIASPQRADIIRVSKRRDDNLWLKGPRRNCCRMTNGDPNSKTVEIEVAPCKDGEVLTMFQ